MNANLLDQTRNLSASQRLELVEALWDDIAARGEVPPPSAAQRAELDRRLADPGAGIDWDQVKAEALARVRS